MKLQTLGLYIQIPFCASKCTFCNFSSQVAPSSQYEDYCAALETELRLLPNQFSRHGRREDLLSLEVDSIYVGGGTPSLLGERRLRKLIESLTKVFRLASTLEFTFEITPGSAGARFLEEMKALGLNRLSIGAQSFDDRELRTVGRLSSAGDTEEQVRVARRAGILEISLDLIAGLPYQTNESWWKSVNRALELSPQHLSVYLFEADEKSRLGKEVIEGGRRFHAGSVPGEEFVARAYEEARQRLAEAGYRQYEISNFAIQGFESRHNLKYWELAPYLGLGAGAHSFDGTNRWANVESVVNYEAHLAQGQLPIAGFRELTSTERIEEFFFLGLRRRVGVSLLLARELWGQSSLGPWEERIEGLVREGWLEAAGSRIRLTDRALLVSNEIFQEFVAV